MLGAHACNPNIQEDHGFKSSLNCIAKLVMKKKEMIKALGWLSREHSVIVCRNNHPFINPVQLCTFYTTLAAFPGDGTLAC